MAWQALETMFKTTRPQVLRDSVHFSHALVEVLFDAQLEIRIGGPSAMVGQIGMLVDQAVDRSRAPLAGTATHHQHVVHDPVRALAVPVDPLQVPCQVIADIGQVPPVDPW